MIQLIAVGKINETFCTSVFVFVCMAAKFHFDPSNWLAWSWKSYVTLTLALWNVVFSKYTDVYSYRYIDFWYICPVSKLYLYTFITFTIKLSCSSFYLQRYKLYLNKNQLNSVYIHVQHNSFKAKKFESPSFTNIILYIMIWYNNFVQALIRACIAGRVGRGWVGCSKIGK